MPDALHHGDLARRRVRSSLLLLALVSPTLALAQAPIEVISPDPQVEGRFATVIAAVPDTDGDGRGDLLVGAGAEDVGAQSTGRAYLYSGATGTLLHTLDSPNSQIVGHFGSGVAGVDDVDGDGHGDVLVGADGEDGGALGAGRAYVFSGATGGLLLTLESPQPIENGAFGSGVAGVPDTDGDGVPDLLVSAYNPFGSLPSCGRVFLFSGASGALLHTLDTAYPTPCPYGQFGRTVAGIEDVDGDGRGDLLVGAPREGFTMPNRNGLVHVYSGATGARLATFESPRHEHAGYFGSSLAKADVDSDGHEDILVGAPGERFFKGRAYVVSGAAVLSGSPGALIHSFTSPNATDGGSFGQAIAGVDDVDGDGYADVLIGAEGEHGGDDVAGRAYVFSGATGTLLRTLESPSPEYDGRFGSAVAGVPDADGDGRGDMFVGAWNENGGSVSNAGRAYLFPSETGIVLSASGSPTTVTPGGALTVTVTATNDTTQPAPLDLWIVVVRNGREVLTKRIGGGTLPPGITVVRAFDLAVRSNTPPGLYTIQVNVGDYRRNVLASDDFDVTVAAGARGSETAAESWAVAPLAGDVFASDAPAASAARAEGAPSVVMSPNPAACRATLRFTLAEAGVVRAALYDVVGREVAVLVDGRLPAGPHAAPFVTDGLANGVYVWRLDANGTVQAGRLTVAR